MKHPEHNKNAGFTLLVAMLVTSVLMLVSFVVVDIATKQLVLAHAAQESQYAFYSAESGMECALYWDLKNPLQSAFATGAMATWAQMRASEYSGINTTNPLDQSSSKSNTPDEEEGFTFNSGFKTTTFANELIYGAGLSFGYTATGPGFNFRSNYWDDIIEDKNVPSIGSYATLFRTTNSYEAIGLMATFRAAAGQTPSHIQTAAIHVDGDPSAGSRVTFSGPSTGGNLIVTEFTYNNSDYTINYVTDNKGNDYYKILSIPYETTQNVAELWYAYNITGGGEPITVVAHSPAFSPVDISCAGENISTGSQVVQTIPSQPSRIGGGGVDEPTSIFQLDFEKGCAIVRVTKDIATGETTIDSRGYNTCDTSASRRFERRETLTY